MGRIHGAGKRLCFLPRANLGFENPALYQIAGASYAANFHDVTAADASPFSGDADNDAFRAAVPGNPNSLYPLANGYDMATGLGSPIGNVLGPSLCSVTAPVFTVTVSNPGAQTSTAGQPVGLPIHATDSGGATLAYAASGLPTGLTIDAASGIISGTPTAPGTFTVTVSAADRFMNSGRTTFTWTVVKPVVKAGAPAISKLSFGNVGKGRAKVSFALAQGSSAPAIRSFTITLPKGLSFARKAKTLSKHISLKGARFTLKLSGGALTITLKNPASKVSFSIGPPATKVSTSLRHRVRGNKVKSLNLVVKVRRRGRQRHQAVRQAQGLGRRAQTGWLGAATAPYSSGRRSPCRSANSVSVLLRVAARSTSAIAHPSSSAVAITHPDSSIRLVPAVHS